MMPTKSFAERIEPHPLDQESALDQFRNKLLTWGKLNFQSFPWRVTHDPYAILMAEIMLHRTQVKQVVPVYIEFLKKYPDITRIHDASDDSVKESLASLGLHWRISLIKEMADQICNKFGSIIPQERELLLSLPGINDYIASAVRCFAWNYPDPIIDTNTVRIIGRVFGVKTKDSSRRNRGICLLSEKLIDQQDPAKFNYALLDLAHLKCHKRVEPECATCPVRLYCVYGGSMDIDIEK
jgi:A/G-specific adenine glycosylase